MTDRKPHRRLLRRRLVWIIVAAGVATAVIGALVFGKMSDRLGRKRLFILTLLLYLVGTGLAAFVTGHHTGWLVFFYLTRFVAGMGIGGQYSAINSAIDEVMPSKYRGRVDIWINGSYWAGAIIGSFVSYIFLNHFAPNVGWRLAFLLGPVLAIFVIIVGRVLPESPRWLVTHGRQDEADKVMATIEEQVRASGQELAPIDESKAIEIVPETRYGYLTFLRLAFHTYTKRAILGATLMITQSFLYNAIFFTYALVLTKFYHESTISKDILELFHGQQMAMIVANAALVSALRILAVVEATGPGHNNLPQKPGTPKFTFVRWIAR
jgi:MFS family permease